MRTWQNFCGWIRAGGWERGHRHRSRKNTCRKSVTGQSQDVLAESHKGRGISDAPRPCCPENRETRPGYLVHFPGESRVTRVHEERGLNCPRRSSRTRDPAQSRHLWRPLRPGPGPEVHETPGRRGLSPQPHSAPIHGKLVSVRGWWSLQPKGADSKSPESASAPGRPKVGLSSDSRVGQRGHAQAPRTFPA